MAKKAKKENTDESAKSGLAGLRQMIQTKYSSAMTQQGACEVLSTGSSHLDKALGIGGLPFGRIVEIYGQESTGKTTLCLSLCARALAQGLTVLYVDFEHAVNPAHAKMMSVDTDSPKFIWVQPDCHEDGTNIAVEAVDSGEVQLVVIDSIAAATPRAELDGEIGDSHMALQARLNSQFMKKVVGPLTKNKCLLLVVNQLRSKVGIVYGNPLLPTGGNSIKYAASIRLDMKREEMLKEGETVVGIKTKVRLAKNKMAAPHTEATFDIRFDIGIDEAADVLDDAVKAGKLVKSGAWFSIASTGEMIGQGRPNALNWLRSNPSSWVELRE